MLQCMLLHAHFIFTVSCLFSGVLCQKFHMLKLSHIAGLKGIEIGGRNETFHKNLARKSRAPSHVELTLKR